MRTLDEEIFDRRCEAAKRGNEKDVQFYDELERNSYEYHKQEEKNGDSFDALEEKIENLERDIRTLKKEKEDCDNLIEDFENKLFDKNKEIEHMQSVIDRLNDQIEKLKK